MRRWEYMVGTLERLIRPHAQPYFLLIDGQSLLLRTKITPETVLYKGKAETSFHLTSDNIAYDDLIGKLVVVEYLPSSDGRRPWVHSITPQPNP